VGSEVFEAKRIRRSFVVRELRRAAPTVANGTENEGRPLKGPMDLPAFPKHRRPNRNTFIIGHSRV